MSEDILAGDLPADESAAAASVEVASDDADAAAAEDELQAALAAQSEDYEEIAALLAGGLISGSAKEAAEAAIARFEATRSQVVFGGPIKAALPEAEEAPAEEAEAESADAV